MHKICVVFSVAVLILYGCTTSSTQEGREGYVTFEAIHANPDSYDMKPVQVQGFIMADMLGGTALYKDTDDAENNRMFQAIDLLPKNGALAYKIKYKSPTCVIAVGMFRTYKKNEIRTDSLASDIGVIDLQDVRQCPNKREEQ